ncbi:MAG TPA: SPASM domain-containing protein, partial [Patescibacteria group bacterium]|nr:SPASM domain-containing protein [Patescibacteria group bacterium]
MPSVSLRHKIKLLSNYIKDLRPREMYNILSVYALWWNHRLSAFLLNDLFPKLGIDLFPPFLEIEHTTMCGFKCKICEHTYWKEPSANMSFEKFKELYDQFGKLKWIGLTGIGSSYLNPDFHRIVAYCKSKGTIVELMDHFATFRDENQIKELLEIGPDFQFVSIYGATKKTSEEVCVGSDFDKVIKNVRTFVELKKKMKKRFPLLSFHYIVTKKSKDEIFQFLDFVKSLDTEIAEVLVTPMLHDFREAKGYSVKLDNDYIERVRKKADACNIAMTINLTAFQEERGLLKRPPFNYCKEYIMPFIFVSGHISPCCGLNEANQREVLKKNSPGNLFERNIREIWYSPQYKRIRQLIRQGKCPKECAMCPAYQ